MLILIALGIVALGSAVMALIQSCDGKEVPAFLTWIFTIVSSGTFIYFTLNL